MQRFSKPTNAVERVVPGAVECPLPARTGLRDIAAKENREMFDTGAKKLCGSTICTEFTIFINVQHYKVSPAGCLTLKISVSKKTKILPT